MSANVQTMMYTGETPWHGFGKHVENALTSADAIAAAGLDWKVNKSELFLSDGSKVPGSFANVRSDNGAVLGVVGSQYTVLQNKDAFSVADAIVGVKEAMYHTAGALGQGERVWMMLKVPGYIQIVGDDVTEKFLLLSNSHDGSGAVEILFTPIRVVCQNTLNQALSGTKNKFKIRHTINMGGRVEDARAALGFANKHFDIFETVAKKMSATKFTHDELKEYAQMSGVIPTEQKMSGRAKNILEELSDLFENGKGAKMLGVRGTVWGAYNSVAEYVDHKRGSDQEKRSISLLYGSGSRIKQEAFDRALVLSGVQS